MPADTFDMMNSQSYTYRPSPVLSILKMNTVINWQREGEKLNCVNIALTEQKSIYKSFKEDEPKICHEDNAENRFVYQFLECALTFSSFKLYSFVKILIFET